MAGKFFEQERTQVEHQSGNTATDKFVTKFRRLEELGRGASGGANKYIGELFRDAITLLPNVIEKSSRQLPNPHDREVSAHNSARAFYEVALKAAEAQADSKAVNGVIFASAQGLALATHELIKLSTKVDPSK